ncbi:MAG: RHS domain-containing protein [Pseudomonadota bacterium]|nr:RHS domain-containing protein [Pseudomonadota bacterium]
MTNPTIATPRLGRSPSVCLDVNRRVVAVAACALAVFATASSVSAQGGYSHSQRYTLDGNGNRTTITDAAGITSQQTFDAFDRLTSITNIEGTTSYTWLKDGTLSTISRANGVYSVYQYDRAKRVTSITHSRNGATTSSFVYNYDLNGNRTKEVVTVAAISGQAGSITTTDYTFDDDDRLTTTVVRHQPPSATMPDESIVWVLDGVGNRRSELVTRLSDNTVTSDKLYTYSPRDQLLLMNDSVSGLSVQYGYSGNGNRTSRTVVKQGQPSQTTQFIFDARDLMIKVQPETPNVAGLPTIEYTYDPEGRRIERIETPATGGAPQVTLCIYTGQTLLHEAVPAVGAGGLRVTDTYRHGANLDRHVAYAPDGEYVLRHYQLDGLGTPIAMTDSTGATVTRTVFDAWGNIREQVAGGMVQARLRAYNR